MKDDDMRALLGAASRLARDSSACPDAGELVALFDGRLGEERRHAVQRHLTGCRACAMSWEGLAFVAEHFPGPLRGEVRPGAFETLAERLRSLVTFEMPRAALVTTRRATTEAPPKLDEALDAYRRGEWQDAAALLREVTGQRGAPAAAFHYLGACLVEIGDLEGGAAALRAAADKARRLGEYRLRLAEALLLAGHGPEAAAELKRAARLPGAHRDRCRELKKRVDVVLAEGESERHER